MVLFFEDHLTHYRVPVLEQLQNTLGENLVVIHGSPYAGAALNTASPEDTLPFEHFKVPTWWIRGQTLSLRAVWKHLGRYEPSVILVRGTIRNIELFPLLFYARVRGIPVITWGQAYSRRRPFRPYRHPIDRAYLAVVQLSDAYVCYTNEIRSTLTQYVSRSKLFVANNTLDTTKHSHIRNKLSELKKENVRESLGLDDKPHICFIGRLQPRKKVGQLIEAHHLLKVQHGLEVGLVIVGDGPEKEALAQKAIDLGSSDVHFVGAKYGESAGRYLYASDLVVIPGWLGLAVNHALIYGRPVVSQYAGEKQYHKEELVGHPPEATHIQPGQNGVFAKHNSSSSLANKIVEVMSNNEHYITEAERYAVSHLTIESMINGFQEAIRYATSR